MTRGDRVVPLEGGRNFRDLGGYPADGGRRVRWGRLYRSGAMSSLTEGDYRHLSDLGIATICDFRTNSERAAEPTLWPGDGGPMMHARDYEMSGLRARLAGSEPTAEMMRAAMNELYANLAYDHVESYRLMFGALLAGRLPLVFNCSAGKDRTGVAAALILIALGVPREEVMKDYSLSDQLVDYEAMVHRPGVANSATGFEFILRLTPEARAPLLRSDPAYLAVALEEIERRDGTVFDYLHAHLGVGPQARENLCATLLTAD